MQIPVCNINKSIFYGDIRPEGRYASRVHVVLWRICAGGSGRNDKAGKKVQKQGARLHGTS